MTQTVLRIICQIFTPTHTVSKLFLIRRQPADWETPWRRCKGPAISSGRPQGKTARLDAWLSSVNCIAGWLSTYRYMTWNAFLRCQQERSPQSCFDISILEYKYICSLINASLHTSNYTLLFRPVGLRRRQIWFSHMPLCT